MMTKDEAMKLALEALVKALPDMPVHTDWHLEAITALREALAQSRSDIEQPSQQEPVVWMYVNKSTHETKFQKHMRDFVDHSLWSEVPLYGEPLVNHELQCVCGAVWLGDELVHLPDKRPPAQQEPVAYDKTEINCFAQDLYDKKIREGKRGHYESMFHVIHQCIKKVSPPEQRTWVNATTWVGLTDEEMRDLEKQFNAERVRTSDEEYLVIYPGDYWAWQRAIEAKLREKNA